MTPTPNPSVATSIFVGATLCVAHSNKSFANGRFTESLLQFPIIIQALHDPSVLVK